MSNKRAQDLIKHADRLNDSAKYHEAQEAYKQAFDESEKGGGSQDIKASFGPSSVPGRAQTGYNRSSSNAKILDRTREAVAKSGDVDATRAMAMRDAHAERGLAYRQVAADLRSEGAQPGRSAEATESMAKDMDARAEGHKLAAYEMHGAASKLAGEFPAANGEVESRELKTARSTVNKSPEQHAKLASDQESKAQAAEEKGESSQSHKTLRALAQKNRAMAEVKPSSSALAPAPAPASKPGGEAEKHDAEAALHRQMAKSDPENAKAHRARARKSEAKAAEARQKEGSGGEGDQPRDAQGRFAPK